MAEKAFAAGPGTCWAPYAPTREAPWDVRRVVHLHRRAGFAAPGAGAQRALGAGPEASGDRLLAGEARRDGVPAEFEATAAMLRDSAAHDLGRLKAWWVYRMLFGPDSLG